MSNVKISQLPNATTPLAGTEAVPIVQSGATVQAPASAFGPTLPITAANGGTGIQLYAIGDLLYASGATTLARLADVATGNVLLSGGVGASPLYGKVNLTSAVTGTLPLTSGGTGQTSANAALNALLPTQSGHSGQFLTSNGSNTSWASASGGGLSHALGTINFDGTIAAFSVHVDSCTHPGTGHWDVFYTSAGFVQRPNITASVHENTAAVVVIQELSNVECEFFAYDMAGVPIDVDFSFIALGP